MIHYHGTPVGGKTDRRARFLSGRHGLVSHFRPEDMAIVADVCQSFVLDNGAFSAWTKGAPLDFEGYVKWVRYWCRHPGFDWALIPDIIDGDETDNDAHIEAWRDAGLALYGVPVWHLHESFDRLEKLIQEWRTIALGSSGQWRSPGTESWWRRIAEVMNVACDADGRPKCRLHGLRMLDPAIFTHLPLSSADSTNACVNAGNVNRFGIYTAPSREQRSNTIADMIEASNSCAVWHGMSQLTMTGM